MSNNETGPFLIDTDGARTLYNDLRGRILPPVDPSAVINDAAGKGVTDKTWSANQEAIVKEQLETTKAPIIIDSVSGNPIVINDGVPGMKLYDMKVSFSPKQAGTGDPSTTNIRPITGWTGVNIYRTGKNLLNPIAENMIYKSSSAMSVVYGDAGAVTVQYPSDSANFVVFKVSEITEALVGVTFVFSGTGTADNDVFLICDSDGGNRSVKPKSYTVQSSDIGRIIAIRLWRDAVGTCSFSELQAEIGSTATAYEPYSGTAIPISWQTEAGTVYRGEFDVSSGELIVTHIMVSDIWGNIPKSSPTTETGLTSGYLDFPENVEQCVNQSKYGDSTYCNMCATIIWGNATFTPAHYYINTQNRVWMAFPTDLDSNTPIQIVGKLVTPRVVNVDPAQISLLVGVNTIWTDADGIEIAYPVDTKKYVDASGVKDVQLNGTSAVVNGVANIPVASDSNFGAVKASVNTVFGVVIDQGLLKASPAGTANIQAGTASRMPITPAKQHESVYYGLAKVAGVDLASATVTLGQYPSAALVAIQKMLGVYQAPWEIINEESFTHATEADKTINTDSYGQAFELTDAILLFELPKLSSGDVDSAKGNYGQAWFYYGNDGYRISPEPGNFSRVAGGDAKAAWYSVRCESGMVITEATSPISDTNSSSIRMRYIQNSYSGMGVFIDNDFVIKSVVIPKVTGNGRYRLYGRRKWH